MGSALLAALVLLLALAGSTGAVAPMAGPEEPGSLTAAFESATLAAEAVDARSAPASAPARGPGALSGHRPRDSK